jgi:outer membrane beta-barrel protein
MTARLPKEARSTLEDKTTMRRLTARLLSALLGVGMVLGAAAEAKAQEIQLTGPLAGAPAVRKLRMYRAGRFEIAPAISFSLLDEYRRTILVGGRLQYNITDWLALGVWGGFGAISTTTDLTDQIDSVAVRSQRTAVNLNHTSDAGGNVNGSRPFADQTAKVQWMLAAPQVQFTPFRGKLAIFQKIFVDTDLYIHGGLGIAGLQERADCGTGTKTACADPASFALANRTAFGPTFGLGINFYTGDFISLGIEYRAFPFIGGWNRSGFDQRGAGNNGNFPDQSVNKDDRTFKFNQLITIAVGFSLPTKPKISD